MEPTTYACFICTRNPYAVLELINSQTKRELDLHSNETYLELSGWNS